MIIVMRDNASNQDINKIISRVEELGYKTHLSQGKNKTIIGIIGDLDREELIDSLGAYPEIEKMVPIQEPYKLAGKPFHPEPTKIKINEELSIGGNEIVVMAGPCAVENEEQLMTTARFVKEAGVKVLRGGAFKPRTSPYSFQGLGKEGLKLLKKVSQEEGLSIVTEVMDPRDVELVGKYTDIYQVGARNMQNFYLLKELGHTDLPILLKRGMSSTYKELLMAAEYIMAEGNKKIILCERGIRTFETYTRNTLDLVSVPVLKKLSHLPVIVDPSHGTGHWELVGPAAKGALAVGADGLLIEVHPDPIKALSDGQQSLKPDKFQALIIQLRKIARAIGRDLL